MPTEILEALDTFGNFISSDSSSAESGTTSDELEEFKPPPGERKRRVLLQNGGMAAARPRRLLAATAARLRQPSVATTPQRRQLRGHNNGSGKSARVKSLSMDTKVSLEVSDEEQQNEATTAVTANGGHNKANTPKKTTTKTVVTASRHNSIRYSSSSSSSSSASESSSLSSQIPASSGPQEAADSVVLNKRGGGGISPTVRKARRGGRSRGGGCGRMSSSSIRATTAAGSKRINNDKHGGSMLSLSSNNSGSTITMASRATTAAGSSKRGAHVARRGGGRGAETPKVLTRRTDSRTISADHDTTLASGSGGLQRGQQRQQQSKMAAGRNRGAVVGGRQRRRNGEAGRGHGDGGAPCFSSSSSESSSSGEEEDNDGGQKRNERGDNGLTLFAEEEDDSDDDRCSSSSSSSTTSGGEDTAEERTTQRRPRGNGMALLSSPPLISRTSQQQRHHQISLHLPPPLLAAPSRGRRKKGSMCGAQKRDCAKPMPQQIGDYDCSNPYDTPTVDAMDPYQRKMREALILYRFLGRSFILRNLYYMRYQRPPLENFASAAHQVFSDGGSGELTHIKTASDVQPSAASVRLHSFPQNLDVIRTSSRISNKFPTTIRPCYIRNNLFFGHKKATVQCFHVSECNGRLSSMRSIPSATFEMTVNERIRNISIDLPDELHANVLDGDKAKLVKMMKNPHFQAHLIVCVNFFMAEYLVIRVLFRFEDAEIGGRHLRKVPSRQSSSGGASSSDHTMQQQHCLRKNGPADACDVVMFGAKRIFSYKPGGDLKVINDEASIDLFSDAQLHFELNCLRLTVAQLSRLIHGALKPPDGGACSPFITVRSHGDSDEEEEEDEDDEAADEQDKSRRRDTGGGVCAANTERVPNAGPKLKRLRMGGDGSNEPGGERANNVVSSEGVSLREALELMDMAESSSAGRRTMGINSSTSTTSYTISRNELLHLPKVIGLKFWLHSPGTVRATPATQSAAPPGSPPGQQRRRLFFRTAAAIANASLSFAAADERPRASAADHWDVSSSSSKMSSPSSYDSAASFVSAFAAATSSANAAPSPAGLLSPPSSSPSANAAPAPPPSPPFVCRPFPASRCFFCLAILRVRTMWALQKHLTFCHPRFDFCYEPSIRVSSTQCLPGFSITQNVKYDTSNELPSVRTAVRPTWLVTKALAKEMRTVDNFPIERYTVMTSKQSTAEEYIRLKGRFSFATPTRIDQPWMRQMSIRKLTDITDLHPAESAMMQMWNGFLLRIRITLFGRRMLYKALRVFVKYHWQDIDRQYLRTHFLLHLTCLLYAGGIDEEERYDLYMRLDSDYDPCGDSRHHVGRELKALYRELVRMASQQHCGAVAALNVSDAGGIGQGINKIGAGKLRQRVVPHNNQRHSGWRMKLRHQHTAGGDGTSSTTTNNNKKIRLNGTLKKAAAVVGTPPRPPVSSPPLPLLLNNNASPSALSAAGCDVHKQFDSCQALREQFPFASGKRIALLWKFLRNYDFPADGGDFKQHAARG